MWKHVRVRLRVYVWRGCERCAYTIHTHMLILWTHNLILWAHRPQAVAKDFETLYAIITKLWPDVHMRPKLIGPDEVCIRIAHCTNKACAQLGHRHKTPTVLLKNTSHTCTHHTYTPQQTHIRTHTGSRGHPDNVPVRYAEIWCIQDIVRCHLALVYWIWPGPKIKSRVAGPRVFEQVNIRHHLSSHSMFHKLCNTSPNTRPHMHLLYRIHLNLLTSFTSPI